MTFTLASIRKALAASTPILLVFGVEGVGKSSLAAEAPAPIFLRTAGENLPADLAGAVDEFPVAGSYGDLLNAIGALITEDHEYKTLVIDALDGAESLVWAETCARNGWKTIEDPGFGKGYVAAETLWKDLLDGLRLLRDEKNVAIVILGHTEIVRFDSPTTDPYSRYIPNMHKKAAEQVKAACDAILFVNQRITLKKVDVGFNKTSTHAEGGGARVIYTEERPGFVAKNRYSMPPEIPYKKGEGWAALAKYFPTVV